MVHQNGLVGFYFRWFSLCIFFATSSFTARFCCFYWLWTLDRTCSCLILLALLLSNAAFEQQQNFFIDIYISSEQDEDKKNYTIFTFIYELVTFYSIFDVKWKLLNESKYPKYYWAIAFLRNEPIRFWPLPRFLVTPPPKKSVCIRNEAKKIATAN